MSTLSEIPQERVELLDQSISSLDFRKTDYSSESTLPSPVKQFQASVADQSRERANEHLRDIGVTPIIVRKLQSRKYQKKKAETMTRMLHMAGIDEKTSDDGEIIAQLKEKSCTANRSEKVQILTVFPQSWSIHKIQTEFGASNFTLRKAQALVAASGILTTPNPKPGQYLLQKKPGSCKFL